MSWFKREPEKEVNKYLPSIPVMLNDTPEEHRVSLPGIEIAIIHSLKVVFMVNTTGEDAGALVALDDWCAANGYHLHCVLAKSMARQPDHLAGKDDQKK